MSESWTARQAKFMAGSLANAWPQSAEPSKPEPPKPEPPVTAPRRRQRQSAAIPFELPPGAVSCSRCNRPTYQEVCGGCLRKDRYATRKKRDRGIYILYRHYDFDGNLLYVGQTCDIPARWRGHMSDDAWMLMVGSSRYEHFTSKPELNSAEASAVRIEKPRWNIAFNEARRERYVT